MSEIVLLISIFIAAAVLFAVGLDTVRHPGKWQQRALTSYPRSRFVKSSAYLYYIRFMGVVTIIFAALVFCCGILYVDTLTHR